MRTGQELAEVLESFEKMTATISLPRRACTCCLLACSPNCRQERVIFLFEDHRGIGHQMLMHDPKSKLPLDLLCLGCLIADAQADEDGISQDIGQGVNSTFLKATKQCLRCSVDDGAALEGGQGARVLGRGYGGFRAFSIS